MSRAGAASPPERARRLAALVLVVAAGACGPGLPPQAPAPLAPPEVEPLATDFSDRYFLDAVPPPPVTAETLADPILGSPAVGDAELERRVNYWILRWQTWGEDTFASYLERMEWYLHLVDEEVGVRELPRSLRYLPLVESGYNPSATSRVGAAGMWQFMSATARFLGLEVTPLIDERRDPWRSTGFALDYLIELNDRFEGSWFLALAAYNGGWGRVQRIIERHGDGAPPSDSLFWALREHFPRETRDYVPKLLAAARVAENPRLYGFEPGTPVEPGWAEEVRVPDATSLDVVARAAGVETAELERLNPQLRRGYTPPDRETSLRVPAGSSVRFAQVFPTIPEDERVSFVEHRIRPGETLSHVADRYRLPLRELQAANPALNPRRLQIGQWLIVPRSPTPLLAAADGVRTIGGGGAAGPSTGGEPAVSTDGGSVTHRVAPGESLWRIARRYQVRVSDLRSWNGLSEGETLHPGDRLEVRGARVAVYRVRPGDTLSGIALRHGVPTDRLLQANGLGRNSVIRPGDEVRIPSL